MKCIVCGAEIGKDYLCPNRCETIEAMSKAIHEMRIEIVQRLKREMPDLNQYSDEELINKIIGEMK